MYMGITSSWVPSKMLLGTLSIYRYWVYCPNVHGYYIVLGSIQDVIGYFVHLSILGILSKCTWVLHRPRFRLSRLFDGPVVKAQASQSEGYMGSIIASNHRCKICKWVTVLTKLTCIVSYYFSAALKKRKSTTDALLADLEWAISKY